MTPIRHLPEAPTGRRPLAPGAGIDAHRHDTHQIVYACRGVLSVTTSAGTWVAPANRAIWIPAGTVHEHRAHGDTDLRLVGLADNPLGLDHPTVLVVGPLLRELIIAYTTDTQPSPPRHPDGPGTPPPRPDDGRPRNSSTLKDVPLDPANTGHALPATRRPPTTPGSADHAFSDALRDDRSPGTVPGTGDSTGDSGGGIRGRGSGVGERSGGGGAGDGGDGREGGGGRGGGRGGVGDAGGRGGGDGGERERLWAVLVDQLKRAPEQPLHLPTARDPRLAAVCAILHRDPADGRTLAQLAAQAGTSDRTLARLCRRELGMSFPQWRTQLRLHQALLLLADGVAVTTVAHRCGWASASAFIDVFRRAFGYTPGKAFTL
ncbi:helix-turn-helix domain-containing protein [Nonomuraea sp. JJY05]|uniref:helix-turn-helix domain-containing protein n=1 Tax=Nonomuraea sp. JJY05 TaxID=3350255 RepID=UPI00373EBF07